MLWTLMLLLTSSPTCLLLAKPPYKQKKSFNVSWSESSSIDTIGC